MISIRHTYEIKDVKGLFAACNWSWLESDADVMSAFNNSFQVYAQYRDSELVGFARLISDAMVYGLLVDFMIHPDHRGLGHGKRLLTFVTENAKSSGVNIIQLLATREGRDLYKSNGFAVCPPDSPGMIKFLNSN